MGFILLCVEVFFPQTVKEAVFSAVFAFATVAAQSSFWDFNFISGLCVYFCVGNMKVFLSPSLCSIVLFCQDCFGQLEYFVFPYQFSYSCSHYLKSVFGKLANRLHDVLNLPPTRSCEITWHLLLFFSFFFFFLCHLLLLYIPSFPITPLKTFDSHKSFSLWKSLSFAILTLLTHYVTFQIRVICHITQNASTSRLNVK